MKNATAFAPAQCASLNEVATQWPRVMRRANRSPVQIMYKGKPSGVLLSRTAYAKLIATLAEAAEDAADIALCEARAHLADAPGVPVEEFVAELQRDGKI